MKYVALFLFLVLSGCSQIEEWRRPELAACENFIQSSLKSPSSYKRAKWSILDQRVKPEVLLHAVGSGGNQKFDDDMKSDFRKPTIRSVLINYDAENSFGVSLRSVASCRFAMSDDKPALFTPKQASENSIQENQTRLLTSAVSGEEAVAADCCLAKSFNLEELSRSNLNVKIYDEGES